jgi:hypothetical protein
MATRQKFLLSPYQASYNNWLIVWDKGYAEDAVPEENPGLLGNIDPSLVSSLTNGGPSISLASYLGWPTYLPFNTSRQLFISTPGDNWENYTVTLIYQNYWGMYFTQSEVLPTTGTAILIGTPTQVINNTVNDNAGASCVKFYYPNRLVDFQISQTAVSALPTGPLYIDFGSKGMAAFNIQESVNYASDNFALEILTDDLPPDPTTLLTQYIVLASNYPRYVFDNQQNATPPGSLVLSPFFIPNNADNPFGASSDLTPSIIWLATQDFPIGNLQNYSSFTNLSSFGGLLNVLIDIGNELRNSEDDEYANESNLLISLIQNGLTT